MHSQPTDPGERKNSAIRDLQTNSRKQEFYRDVGSSASSSIPDTPTARLRRLLPTACGIIRPYWASEDRWAAWGLLLVVVALSLGMVYINVLFNQWNNAFYTALQDKNQTVFLKQLIRVCWLVGIFIFLAVYQLYLNQMLQIRWRRWLTERYLRAWLADGAYYRMQLLARETDNPDQRIAEDVNLLISGSLDLLVGRASRISPMFEPAPMGISHSFTCWRPTRRLSGVVSQGHLQRRFYPPS